MSQADKRRPAKNAAAATSDSQRIGRRRWTALDELERERWAGTDPRNSRLWLRAPDMLKRDLVYGYIDAESFWHSLGRWLEWERVA